MQEIELKILNIDRKKIIRKILSLGAKEGLEELIEERYYDTEAGDITNKKNMLRLREVGSKSELTYKDGKIKNKDFLIYEEIESLVGNFQAIDTILKKLGFKLIIERQKNRKSFLLNSLKVEIHQYPKIPAWLELEGEKEAIYNMLEKLGYEKSQTTSQTDSEIIDLYGLDYKSLKF